jgi:hypothetical protein
MPIRKARSLEEGRAETRKYAARLSPRAARYKSRNSRLNPAANDP